jgi:pimeloyl-ACP methyl ester carboxylesterase
LPGHGDAARLTAPLDLGTVVAAVAGRLGDGVDVLVGHSLGAVTAVALAAHYPGLVRAVVAEDPPGSAGPPDPDAAAARIRAEAAGARADPDAMAARELAANPRWRPEDAHHSVEGMATLDDHWVGEGMRGALRWDTPALFAAVPVPVLLITGPERPGAQGNAGAVLRGDRAAILAGLPADRVVVLDGGHCLHRDQPAAYVAAVTAFAAAV